MADYINRDEVIALIEEKQKMICPAGRFGRQYVYGSDRATFDDWQKLIESINKLSHIEIEVEESNEPLTLDELRGMGRDPVWVHNIKSGARYWWIVSPFPLQNNELCENYAKTWIAYRRKPEVNDED